MKKQIVVIHGGTSAFKRHEDFLEHLKKKSLDLERSRGVESWKSRLPMELGDTYDVIYPTMPNRENAHYDEWKIWFEKYIPLLQEEVILIGHSLGAIFLAKYLSEEKFPKKITATFLVAAPFETGGSGEYAREMGEFSLPSSLKKFQEQGGKVFIYHSKDDPIVSFSEFLKYKAILPTAHFREFESKAHFNGADFPELIEDIKSIAL